MEAFVLHKRRIAKAIFITFFALIGVFLTIYATVQVYNLCRIKNAFELSFQELKNIWQKPLSDLPIPDFEKNSLYSFDIRKTKDSSPALTAVYTPDEGKSSGDISFVNSKGESANLYEIMEFFNDVKDTAGNFGLEEKSVYSSSSLYFDAQFIETAGNGVGEEAMWKKLAQLLSSEFSMPKISKTRLGYNMAVLLSKMDVSTGKSVRISSYPKNVMGRKYTFKAGKKYIEDFINRITTDGSIENNAFLSELKSTSLLFLKSCSDNDFTFNIILQKGSLHSIECITPDIYGSVYMISASKGDTFGDISAQAVNISKKEKLFEISADSDGKNISLLCNSPSENIDFNAKANKSRANLTFDYRSRFQLNLQSRKEKEGYSIDFYPDSSFVRPPFLNVFMVKGMKETFGLVREFSHLT